MKKNTKILVLDDKQSVLDSFRLHLVDTSHNVEYFSKGEDALIKFSSTPFDYAIAFVDYNLADSGEYKLGVDVVKKLKEINEDLVVVMISADKSDEAYSSWIEADADKVLYKPISKNKVLANIEMALAQIDEEIDEDELKGKNYSAKIDMIGPSVEFQKVARDVLKFSKTDAEVLILGETGTGKELVAKAIHKNSNRSKSSFLVINCSSYKGNSELLESELFGHEKGAFTGADQTKIGVFEAANGSSIFLDEIHHLSKEAQAKLLRVIQEKKIRRVGGTRELSVDFRLICAGKSDLKNMCKPENSEFLPDLYYRISTLDVVIPSLRERTEDILPLLIHFKKKAESRFGKTKEFSSSAIKSLKAYSWPGNIRELERLIQKLYVVVDGTVIRKKHLPDEVLNLSSILEITHSMDFPRLEKLQQEQQKKMILDALKETGHNIKKAAEVLNIKRTTLNSRMKNLEIFDLSPDRREGLLQGIISNISYLRV